MRIQIASSQALDYTDEHCGDDRAGDAVETADEYDCENLEPDQPQSEAPASDEGPQRAAKHADRTGDAPNNQDVTRYIDADRHGRLLIIGYCAQRHAGSASLMKPGDQRDRGCRNERSDQLVCGDMQIIYDERLRRDREQNAAWDAAGEQLGYTANECAN